MDDKALLDKEVIRNLQTDLTVCRNLHSEYVRITQAQLASQNTVIANLIKEKEECKQAVIHLRNATETLPEIKL